MFSAPDMKFVLETSIYMYHIYAHLYALVHLAMPQLKEILKGQKHSLLQPKLTASSAKPHVCQIRLKEGLQATKITPFNMTLIC